MRTALELPSAAAPLARWQVKRTLAVALAAATGSSFSVALLILLSRRASGDLRAPLSLAGVLVVLAVCLITVGLVRWRLPAMAPRQRAAALGLLAAGLLLVGLILTIPGTAGGLLFGLWTVLLLSGTALVAEPPVRRWFDRPSPARDAETSAPRTERCVGESDERCWQHTNRRRADDGSDTLTGFVRVAFAPGQRSEVAHLAFCPPFAVQPMWDAEQTDGPEAKLKASVLQYGVRLELKLASEPIEPTEVTLEFVACEAAASGPEHVEQHPSNH